MPGTGGSRSASQAPGRSPGGAAPGADGWEVQQGALSTGQLTGRSGTKWIFQSCGWDTWPPRALAPEVASSPVPRKVEQLAFLAEEPGFEG